MFSRFRGTSERSRDPGKFTRSEAEAATGTALPDLKQRNRFSVTEGKARMIKVKALKQFGGEAYEFEFTVRDLKDIKRDLIRAVFAYNLSVASCRSDAITWTAEMLNYSERWVWECVRE